MICYGKAAAAPTKSAYDVAFKTALFPPVQNEKSDKIALVQNVNLIKPRKQFFLPLDHWNNIFI